MLPTPGQIFERKYRIECVLGKGAFGQVYRAVVDEIQRKVAIKILIPQQLLDGHPYDEELEARFLREARLLSELQSPHTIRMFDYGRSEEGLLYMIFEYIDGEPLDEVIARGKLKPKDAVHILKQVLESLREAHWHGIQHRDIKPPNIMIFPYLGDDLRAKLLDFGVARAYADPESQLTMRGMRVGTIRYMSPEQNRGEDLTPASDIYGLGLVLYEMLTGRHAIETDDLNIITMFHLRETPIELPPKHPLPHKLREIAHRMLAKPLSERFPSASDVLVELEQIDYEDVCTVEEDDFMDQTVQRVSPFAAKD